MTDVLKLALDRRAELQEEVARMDDFIRMADSLLRTLQPPGEKAESAGRDLGLPREVRDAFREPQTVLPPETSAGVTPGFTRMDLMRRVPTTING